MNNQQEKAALNLTDQLYAFAEAFNLDDDWVKESYETVRQEVLNIKKIDISE